MVDMYGTPFSPALHVVERYRMVDYDEAQAAVARNLKENARVPDTASDLSYRGKRLQVVFTVEDEGVFTMPWSGAITYERPAMAWEENVCAENLLNSLPGKTKRSCRWRRRQIFNPLPGAVLFHNGRVERGFRVT